MKKGILAMLCWRLALAGGLTWILWHWFPIIDELLENRGARWFVLFLLIGHWVILLTTD